MAYGNCVYLLRIIKEGLDDNHPYMKYCYALLISFWGIQMACWGQVNLQGSVYDGKTTLPVEQATVSLLYTNYESVTDAQGYFTITDVAPGAYPMRFSKPGYIDEIRLIEVGKRPVFSIGVKLIPTLQHQRYDQIQAIQRIPRKSLWVPQSVTIYDQAQLKWATPLNVPDWLSMSPGVWQTRDNPGNQGLQIRGVSGNRIGLMVDGVRLRGGFRSFDQDGSLSLFEPYLFDRAEIIRGGGAIPFSSHAVGGVINLDTDVPAFSGDSLQLNGQLIGQVAGPALQQKVVGRLSLSERKLALSVGIGSSWQGTYPGGQQLGLLQGTDFSTQYAQAKARIRLTPKQELVFSFRGSFQQGITESGQRPMLYQQFTYPKRNFQLISAKYSWFTEKKWAKRVSILTAWQRWEEESSQQVAVDQPIFQYEEQSVTTSTTIEVQSEPFSLWHAITGLDWYHDEMGGKGEQLTPGNGSPDPIPTRIPQEATQTNLALYSYHAIDILKLRLTVGGRTQARLDGIGAKPGRVARFLPINGMGHIAVMYPLNPEYQVYLSSQTSRRLPNLFDYNFSGFIPLGYAVAPDTLGAEQAFSSEIGIKAQTEYFTGSLGLFRTEYTDYIDWVSARLNGQSTYQGVPVFTEANIGDAFIQGIEADVEVPVSRKMVFYGGLSYLYGRDQTRDQPLSRIAPFNSRLGLRFSHHRGIWSSLEWRHANRQARQGITDLNDARSFADGTPTWDVVNLMVGYDFRWGYATIGVRNLLNDTYFTHGSGLSAPGRLMMFAVKIGF